MTSSEFLSLDFGKLPPEPKNIYRVSGRDE